MTDNSPKTFWKPFTEYLVIQFRVRYAHIWELTDGALGGPEKGRVGIKTLFCVNLLAFLNILRKTEYLTHPMEYQH